MTVTVHRGVLTDPVAEAVRDLAAAARDVDGIEPLGEQTLLDLTRGEHALHVLADESSGALVGYAQVTVPEPGPTEGGPAFASGELVVRPDVRRRGVGRRLLATLLTAVPGPGPAGTGQGPRLAVWAHGDLPGAQALARSAHLDVVRELWRMSLPLAGRTVEVVRMPAAVGVRPFVVGTDEAALLDVNAQAFAWHPEQGHLDLADLEAREREPWFSAADVLLAERDGEVLGFAWLKVEPGSGDGELYVLGVAPQAQGLGLGRALTSLAIEHLATRGLDRVVLFTEADNTAAVRTYTSAGFVRDRTDVQYA
ncbi:MAG: mycothiol synthase [Cellulomonadaceae bacterium]|nr:mycothiol synthase [Cellulomonadaceae bacterium]